MYARQHRAAIILAVVALALFIVRWPLDDYMCNPKTWHSKTLMDKRHPDRLASWRLPASESGGENFFTKVFRGGGGTPAIFAMLGGQRYLVANILWTYSDVLFHKGKPYEMVQPLESAVTLNPAFTDAWSVYGWHLAWNLYTYTDDLALKAKWMRAGEAVYLRAVDANPDKPRPYFDTAWLYIQRRGDYNAAMPYLRAVVYNVDLDDKPLPLQDDKTPVFEPLTPKIRKEKKDVPDLRERYWDTQTYANRLAYVYKKLGIITKQQGYFDRALKAYDMAIIYDPENTAAKSNRDELVKKRHDRAWINNQRVQEDQYRERFGLPPVDYAASEKAGMQVNADSEGLVLAPDTSNPSAEFYGESGHTHQEMPQQRQGLEH